MKVFLTFEESDLAKVKADLLAYLPAMSSGHRLEAFSAGLGFRTYAALTAALPNGIRREELDPGAFVERVVALGYDPKDLMPEASIHSGAHGQPGPALEMIFRQVVSPLSIFSREANWRESGGAYDVASSIGALFDKADVVFKRFGLRRASGDDAARSQAARGHIHLADNCQNGLYVRIFASASYGDRRAPFFEVVPQEQCCDAIEATKDAIEAIEAVAKGKGAVVVFQEIDDVPFLRPYLEARGYGRHPYDDAVLRGMVARDFSKALA